MSLFKELKQSFENEIGIPVVSNEAGRFQTFGNENLSFIYGQEDGELPELPPISYGPLFAKSYYFNEFFGNNENDFLPHKNSILKNSFNCLADAMERYVLVDDPCDLHDLTSADDLLSASEDFADYHSNTSISLSLNQLMNLSRTLLSGRTSIVPVKQPFSWNYLDSIIPFFNHTKSDLTKAIVYQKDESFVISDITYKIERRRLWITFFIGLNSKDKIKVFNLP